MSPVDLRLYLVTDPYYVPAHRLVSVVLDAVLGGVTVVQLRDKESDGRALYEAGRALAAALAPLDVALLVNDRVDVAHAVGAGVHLGQSDLHVEVARRILGPRATIGLSVDSVEQAREADGADYLAASPVFPTPSKADAGPALGLDAVRALRGATTLSLVGIGGVSVANAADVIKAGADGIAVVSAILASDRPREAAAELRAAVDRALLRRSET